jgi:adenine-specific DNA-methyltransferase
MTIKHPEQLYLDATSRDHRKRHGQFFTPYPVARFMARWLFAEHPCQAVLDPAVGTGVFLRAILESGKSFDNFTGLDIDQNILTACANSIESSSSTRDIKLRRDNYLLNKASAKYDGIICNPPYINFRNYDNKDALIESVRSYTGWSLSSVSNIHGLFLAKTLHQIGKNGRMAFILPSEFLNSNYGRDIKKMLIRSGNLRYVCLFDTGEALFDGVITTACILLFSRDNHGDGIEFMNIGSQLTLQEAETALSRYPDTPVIGRRYKPEYLDPSRKWRHYYQESTADSGSNLVPFSRYGRVLRGIATGANSYFTFNNEKIKETGVNEKFLVPCITRAAQAPDPIFSSSHLRKNIEEGKNAFLLDVKSEPDEKLRVYLDQGISVGIDKRYLPAHRKHWYTQENRPPAPIWVSTFSRGNIRFIRNEAGIRNMTAFHCVYLKPEFEEYTNILFCYFLTTTARELLAGNRREYGNGLNKYEPGDLKEAGVIDLEVLSEEAIAETNRLYIRLRKKILGQNNYSDILRALDMLFSEYADIAD